MRKPVLTAAILLAAACCLGSCAVGDRPGARTYAWPFYDDYFNQQGTSNTRAAGPFYEHEKRADGYTRTAVRPFYVYTSNPSQFEEDRLFFYPLARFRQRERPAGQAAVKRAFTCCPLCGGTT